MPQILEDRPEILEDRRAAAEPDGEVETERFARRRAVNQIERRRRFHVQLVSSAVGMGLLVLIWATSEYHNAGGWPVHGFSQSSGIHDVWNFWIVYPLIAWALIISARAWSVYGRKPIPESEIRREIERQRSTR